MSYRANKLRQKVPVQHVDLQVTTDNPYLFVEILFEIQANAWDEGAEFVLEHIYGEPVEVSEYNPYRDGDDE